MKRPLNYFLSRLRRLDVRNMVRIAGKITAEYRTPRILILIDMVLCSVRFYAGYYDYHEWDFNLMNWRERKTFLTRPQANQLTLRLNNLDFAHLFRNKTHFNKLFAEYLGREWIDARESSVAELEKFVARHGRVFLKDPENLGGYGLEKVEGKDVSDFTAFHTRLLEQKQYLVEQFITQHPDLERLAPGSVNTLRIITYFDGTTPHVLAHAFKMGAGADLDNFGQGGIQTTVYEDGLLPYGAFSKEGDKYTVHPLSGVSIVGFRIPFYLEALELAKTLSQKVREVPYIGWDIAITPTGPIVIEGNYNSGVFQMKPSLSGLKIGLRPTYQDAVGF
jgi:Sugar-transfer associated ATP-grasp